MSLKDGLKIYTSLADHALERYMSNALIPESLRTAMAYSLYAGGKRLRPCMTLGACDMTGGDLDAALPIACGIEMIHTYSLIHDDLPCMDDDDFRRGKPSNHKMFGESTAVLAGDGLLSYAFEIMLEGATKLSVGVEGYMSAIKEVAKGAGVTGMVAGQIADLENEDRPAHDEATLLNIHRRKTGAMLTASVLAGVCIGKDASAYEPMRVFGEQYGLLFQITDDLLDVEGDIKVLGKTIGKDAASNKLTFVTLFGAEEARRRARLSADAAKSALSHFGASAEFFSQLIDYTLTRDK